MSHNLPGPQQPPSPNGQPGYGYPQQPAQQPQWAQQQPYTGPAPYQPPPQPKKHMSGWAITGITIGGLFGGLLLLGAVGAALDGPSSSPAAAASESPRVKAPAAVDADAKPATNTPATPQKPAPKPKPKTPEYPNGDYIVGEDIPPGIYQTDGAEKGIFEFCSITTDPTDGSFGQMKSSNADERIIITLAKGDGVVSISGCEPLKPRE